VARHDHRTCSRVALARRCAESPGGSLVTWFVLIVLALILTTVPMDRHPWPAVCIALLIVAVVALDCHVRGLL